MYGRWTGGPRPVDGRPQAGGRAVPGRWTGGPRAVDGRPQGGGQMVDVRWTGGPRTVHEGRLMDYEIGRFSSDLITAAPEYPSYAQTEGVLSRAAARDLTAMHNHQRSRSVKAW